MKFLGMCLNWKVVVGLALVALGIWTLAPNLIGSALPVLIVLACPLSMLLMMRGMGNMGNTGHMGGMGGMESNMDSQSAARSMPPPQTQRLAPAQPLSNTERLAELRAQVDDLQAEQHAIAHAIAILEDPTARDGRQGEGARRVAEHRAPSASIGA